MNDDQESTKNLPILNHMHANKRKSLFNSTEVVSLRDVQYNNLYKDMFDSKTTSYDIKNMKRFIKRKINNDNLYKPVEVPKSHWRRALRRTIEKSPRPTIDQIVTLIAEPRKLGTPEHPRFLHKTREYINRPISARRYKNRLRINKIRYNTEISIIEENDAHSDDDSDPESDDSFSSSDNDVKYKYYNETSVDNLSEVPKLDQNFEEQDGDTLQQKVGPDLQMARRKSIFRKKTIIFNSANFENSDSDSEKELQLDGDYIIRKALLKDHNIGELADKEMKYCLNI